MEILIRHGELDACFQLASHMVEFSDRKYPYSEYIKRIEAKKHSILTAYVDGQIAGFKIGYEKNRSTFYSWMGGVLPVFRRLGVAKVLAAKQEHFARHNDYQFLEFKTRNYLKPMLIFGINNGFYIIGVDSRENPLENRIILQKNLSPREQGTSGEND